MTELTNPREFIKMFQVSDAPSSPTNYIHIPILGRAHFVRDSKGIMSAGFVLLYWIYGTFTSLFIVILPQYEDGHISPVFVAFFMCISLLCLTSFIRASTTNPGRIPNEEESVIETQKWTFCQKCNRKRPPRSHHCRRCGQCVMRMDHHCPWINNCVGEENHYAFFLLLFYAFMLSSLAFILCMLHFWVYPKCKLCNAEAFHIKHSIWFLYLLVILAVNMALMMGMQLIGQHFNLMIDRTTLENMQNPPLATSIYFRNMLSSYEDLCGGRRSTLCLWFFPCRKRTNFKVVNPYVV